MTDSTHMRSPSAPSRPEALRDPDPYRELLAGLAESPRRIPSKYHYDERGSELFEEITRLDEYYLTRTERALLERWAKPWVDHARPFTLVELGAGSAEKSRVVLDALVEAGPGSTYVPVDVSAEFLAATSDALRAEYPGLSVVPQLADFGAPLGLPDDLPRPRWIAFLGSTLGNFERGPAVDLLQRIAASLATDDRFVLGVDLRPSPEKTTDKVERAYNDTKGITAEFSLNILNVVNDTFGSDFDPSGFRHRSHYVAEAGRIETYLVSCADQRVRFPDGATISIANGELIRSEISAKYDRPTIDDLFAASGLEVDRWAEDDDRLYALILAKSSG